VMYLGRVAEAGDTATLFERPQHPYTEALLAASPELADDPHSDMPTLEGSVPDPARPPRGCRFHTRCPKVTPICGWEIDDVVRWLEIREGLFDALAGVERAGPFQAALSFDDEASAERLAAALRSDAVPIPMRAAMEDLSLRGREVRLRFRETDDVELTRRGPGHVAACVLDRAPERASLHGGMAGGAG
jgi:oligopeptide/dipeptide ABC transporter ATP-binding protein